MHAALQTEDFETPNFWESITLSSNPAQILESVFSQQDGDIDAREYAFSGGETNPDFKVSAWQSAVRNDTKTHTRMWIELHAHDND